MAQDASPMDPQENPVGTEHLPAVGEVGVGEVTYHDPTTTDTDDSTEHAPSLLDTDNQERPGTP